MGVMQQEVRWEAYAARVHKRVAASIGSMLELEFENSMLIARVRKPGEAGDIVDWPVACFGRATSSIPRAVYCNR